MCRLIGYVGDAREGRWGETYHILESMFVAAEAGGNTSASGFASATSPFKNPLGGQIITDKAGIRASKFVRESAAWRLLRHRRSSIVITHNRCATHGAPEDNRNNHPFVSDDGWLYLIHNGVIRDHRQIARRHGLKLVTQCDSEVLLRLMASFSSPLRGLKACLREAQGSVAVAVLDARREVLWLARNARSPLWLCKLEDRQWFVGSTPELILTGLKEVLGDKALDKVQQLFPLADNHVHLLSPVTGRFLAAGG